MIPQYPVGKINCAAFAYFNAPSKAPNLALPIAPIPSKEKFAIDRQGQIYAFKIKEDEKIELVRKTEPKYL